MQIVKAYSGQIEFLSFTQGPDKGSTFVFSFELEIDFEKQRILQEQMINSRLIKKKSKESNAVDREEPLQSPRFIGSRDDMDLERGG